MPPKLPKDILDQVDTPWYTDWEDLEDEDEEDEEYD